MCAAKKGVLVRILYTVSLIVIKKATFRVKMATLNEESAILSLQLLLKDYPSGIHLQEVNRVFARRFG